MFSCILTKNTSKLRNLVVTLLAQQGYTLDRHTARKTVVGRCKKYLILREASVRVEMR
jgi:hypothetical protein